MSRLGRLAGRAALAMALFAGVGGGALVGTAHSAPSAIAASGPTVFRASSARVSSATPECFTIGGGGGGTALQIQAAGSAGQSLPNGATTIHGGTGDVVSGILWLRSRQTLTGCFSFGGDGGSGGNNGGAGGVAAGVALGSDFSTPVLVAGGGGGAAFSTASSNGGGAGLPKGVTGGSASGTDGQGGTGGNNTTMTVGTGGAGAGACGSSCNGLNGTASSSAGPGGGGSGGKSGNSGTQGAGGGGAGAGYFGGGGGGGGNSTGATNGGGGGGGSDFCASSLPSRASLSGCRVTGTASEIGGFVIIYHFTCRLPGQVSHFLTASTNVGTINGLFCVNPSTGIGTYTQIPVGTQRFVSGTGVVHQVFGITTIAASGNNLSLSGQHFGSINQFAESAPVVTIGTFSLS